MSPYTGSGGKLKRSGDMVRSQDILALAHSHFTTAQESSDVQNRASTQLHWSWSKLWLQLPYVLEPILLYVLPRVVLLYHPPIIITRSVITTMVAINWFNWIYPNASASHFQESFDGAAIGGAVNRHVLCLITALRRQKRYDKAAKLPFCNFPRPFLFPTWLSELWQRCSRWRLVYRHAHACTSACAWNVKWQTVCTSWKVAPQGTQDMIIR